ncbi:MAG: HEAT repeat domain-containing protein, partial [Proteobacteria bacterium]|nr:HEAT repeat domain-containing protein [Pseudomonadota bacterium]
VGDERAVVPLIEFLEKSEDKESREKAALALGQLGDERAVTSLVKVLEVHITDAEVCIGIVTALGQIGNEKAIEALVNALSDLRSKSDPLALVVPTVGDFARIALVEIGEPSLGPLTKALGNERVWVRRSAESAIKSIHDKALEDEKK